MPAFPWQDLGAGIVCDGVARRAQRIGDEVKRSLVGGGRGGAIDTLEPVAKSLGVKARELLK